MKSKKFKWGNPLFVAFLAIAGIIGVSATVIDKQVKEEAVVEKADADSYVWDGTMTVIRVQDDPGNVRTLKLAGTISYQTGYGDGKMGNFLDAYYHQPYSDWDYQTNQKRYKHVSANEIYLTAGGVTGATNDYSIFYIPTWVSDVQWVYLINGTNGQAGRTLCFGSLSGFAEYGKENNTTHGSVGNVVGKTVTVSDFSEYAGVWQMKAEVTSQTGVTSGRVTINKKYLTSSNTIKEETEYSYQYAIPNALSSPESISGYLNVESNWKTGTTYSGATTTYTTPDIYKSATPEIITATTTINIVAKYVKGKYVFFTDNMSRSINRVYYEGPTLTNSFTGASNMSVFYKNGNNNWVYYGLVPEDTTKLAFNNGSTGGYNQTVDITGFTLNDHNAWYCNGTTGENKYNVSPWDITSDVTPLYAGETLYIYRTDAADDTDYAIYFFNKPDNSHGVDAWSSKGTVITDAGSAFNLGSGHGIYKITVPSDQPIWAKYIVTRYSKTQTPSTNKWDGVTSQTPDLTANGTNSFGFNSTTSVVRDNRYNDTVIYSNIFGYHVLSQTNGVCVADGSTNTETLAAKWATLKTEYDSYNTTIQGAIWTATTTGSDSLSLGMARYDYIVLVKKYNLLSPTTDFVNRNHKNSGSSYKGSLGLNNTYNPFNLIVGNEDNLSTVIIIVASSVALLSVTALSILVIKKRKNKEE